MVNEEKMKLGLRVVRGPDWKWGNQDDGKGHVGTLIGIGSKGSSTSPKGTVVIQWDSGIQTNYRSGYQNAYDLRVLDNAPTGVRHNHVTCAYCENDQGTLVGFKWSCLSCPDVNLCSNCYMTDKHDLTHAFKRYNEEDESEGELLTPRVSALKIPLKGIFRGCVVQRGPNWNWANQDGGKGNIGLVLDVSGWEEESGRSVVTVKWESNQSANVYRCGHKGKVDIQYVPGREASSGFYYPEHIPVLRGDQRPCKNTQSPSSESNYENVDDSIPKSTNQDKEKKSRWSKNSDKTISYEIGNVVRIESDAEKLRLSQIGHGEWNEGILKELGKTGRITHIFPTGDVRVSIEGQNWILNPRSVVRILTSNETPSSLDPLVFAAHQGHIEALKKELTKVHHYKSIRLALQTAAKKGFLDIAKYLVNQFPDEVDVLCGGKTALHVAAHQGQISIVELLLSSGADVGTSDDEGDTALHYAAFGSQASTLEALLSKSSLDVINSRNKKQCSALHVAVNMNDESSVKTLLRHNININLQDVFEDTAFHEAVLKNNEAIILALINDPKIDFRLRNKRGFNGLQYAALKGNAFALKALLSISKSLLNVKKQDGFSPLHLACLNGHLHVTKVLLSLPETDIHIRNNRGQTPLHVACGQGHSSIVELLLSSPLLHSPLELINAKDDGGDTALHASLSREGFQSSPPVGEISRLYSKIEDAGVSPNRRIGLSIASYLLNKGANLELKNKALASPLDLLIGDPVSKALLSSSITFVYKGKDKETECLICCEYNSSLVTFVPCGHSIVCLPCSLRMKKCLSCKGRILSTNGTGIGHSGTGSSTTNSVSEVLDLRAKVRDFEDNYLCTICMERKRNVAFQCGHSSCEPCSETLRSCHMCRGSIEKKINLY